METGRNGRSRREIDEQQVVYDTDQILAAAPGTDREYFQRPIGQTLADGTTLKTLLHF